jgi:hypothetical protein
MCNASEENHQRPSDTGETVVVTVPWLQQYGRDWLRYPSANVVTVSSHLDAAGRQRALTEAGVL